METNALIELLSVTIMMFLWLSLVAVTIVILFKKINHSEKNEKKPYVYLFFGFIIIFLGDLLHTIGSDINIANPENFGTVGLLGGTFEIHTFTLFFDGLAFIIFYMMLHFFIVYRYQKGELKRYDKVVLTLSTLSIVFILASPYIESNIIDYEVAWFSPHIILFTIFGIMVVGKLMYETNKRKSGEEKEEKFLYLTSWGFVVSFLFFILTLVLLPINSAFGMMMIPKTFAYTFALISLNKGLVWKKND